MQALWHFTTHPEVRIVRFGSEAVVFNPLSWETHLLNQTAAHVVGSLRRGPQTIESLASALVDDLDPECAPEAYADQIAGLLEELEGLGLVVQEAPETAAQTAPAPHATSLESEGIGTT